MDFMWCICFDFYLWRLNLLATKDERHHRWKNLENVSLKLTAKLLKKKNHFFCYFIALAIYLLDLLFLYRSASLHVRELEICRHSNPSKRTLWSLFYLVRVYYISLHFLSIVLIKPSFHFSVFWFFVFLYLWILVF